MRLSRRIQELRRRIAALGLRLYSGQACATAPQPLPPSGIFRVLICRVSHSLGNTLLITPLLQEVEAIWPGAEIDIVTRNPVAPEIFAGYACVREVICLPRQGLRHPLSLWRGLRRLLRARYDLAIDTDPRSQTGRALLLRSHARFKLGFSGPRKSGAISHAVDPYDAPRHNGQYPIHLLRQALQRKVCAFPPLDLRLNRFEREQGGQILTRVASQSDPARGRRGVIGIFANATGTKLLSREWWQEFMPAVDEHFTGYGIVEIVPMSAQSLLICLDSGVMHLARAAGTRTAALFTQTDIAEWGPYGEGAHAIDAARLSAAQAAQQLIAAVPLESLEQPLPVLPPQAMTKRASVFSQP